MVPNISNPWESSRANREHNSSLVLDAAERFLRGKTPLWYHGKDNLRKPRFVCISSCLLAGLLSYLRYLWLFTHSGVQDIFCCVLLCFSSSCVPCVAIFSGLSIFITLSVFSNVYFLSSFNFGPSTRMAIHELK